MSVSPVPVAAPRLTHGELFAGVGGFGQGFERASIQTRWRVEIDHACRSVLRRHYPHDLVRSDVRLVSGGDLPPVDIVSAGFPCQDLSVAGQRRGLEGNRSGLFFEIPRLVREMREATLGCCPTVLVLENVPGLLSSHGGRDFAVVLGALAQLGSLDICWRVLDSQHFGVAQKRRRLFLVLDFAGQRAAQVLFEPQGGARHPAPGREARSGVAAALTAGSASGRGVNRPGRRREDDINLVPAAVGALTSRARRGDGVKCEQVIAVAGGQTARYGKGTDSDATDALVAQCHGSNVGAMGTLRAGNGHTTGGVPFVAQSLTVSYGKATDAAGRHGSGPVNLVAHALTAEGHDASEDGTGRGVPLGPAARPASYGVSMRGREGGATAELREEQMSALRASQGGGDKAHVLAFAWQQGEDSKHGADGRGRSWIARAGDYAAGLSASRHDALAGDFGVRRLTPTECERLMGWPDGWTEYDDEGRRMTDSARYRMIGNGVVANVTEWIGRRIVQAIAAYEQENRP